MENEEHSDILTDSKSIQAKSAIKDLELQNEQLRMEISERIIAQNSMRQGQTFLQLIISSIDEMFIFIIDDAGIVNFVWAPQILEQNYGLQFNDYLGKKFEEFIQDLMDIKNKTTILDLIKKKESFRKEFLFATPNGQKWIDTTFSPLEDKENSISGTVIASRDITEIKKITNKLKKSEERFRKMAETIQDGIIIFENRNLVYKNDRVNDILGYTGSDLIEAVKSKISLEDRKRVNEFLDYFKKTGKFTSEISYWIILDDGERRCILNKFSATTFGKKSYIFVAISDITEQERAKLTLEKINVKLEQLVIERTNELQEANRMLIQEIDEHKQTELELERRFDFEKTIAEISSQFLKDQNFENGIDFTLELLGKFSDASRAYIFEFNDDLTLMENTHEWCNVGVTPANIDHDEILTEKTPWWIEQLLKGKVIHLKSLSELPEEAISTRQALESHNIKSILTMPIIINSKLKGFIGFDDVKNTDAWNKEDIRIIKVAAEILSHVTGKIFKND